jgi:hypothetical protein
MKCEETGDKTLAAGLKAYIATEGVCAGAIRVSSRFFFVPKFLAP